MCQLFTPSIVNLKPVQVFQEVAEGLMFNWPFDKRIVYVTILTDRLLHSCLDASLNMLAITDVSGKSRAALFCS